MPAARLGEAFDERFRLGVEIEEAHAPARGAQTRQRVGEVGEARGGLGVERDRDAVAPRAGEITGRLGDQRQRQVVDGVVAGVLERHKSDALAGARNAADQEEVHFDRVRSRVERVSRRWAVAGR